MLRPALALLLLAAAHVPAASAYCDPTGQVCQSEEETGSCESFGSGTSEVRARNVMAGAPLVASWRWTYTCASTARTDVWETNATYGTSGARVRWESQPYRDNAVVRIDLTGPSTNTTTYWYARSGECTFWTLGVLAGVTVDDNRACPAGPPKIPVLPWRGLLP